jgi:hypothetical protein
MGSDNGHHGVALDFGGPPITLTTGAEILDQVVGFISRYMKMTDAQLIACALWVAHTYAVMVAYWTPYLNINSPEKRCAKSRLMEVLRYLVWAAWITADATPAALFRKIAKIRPTLFLDETDALFKGDKEKAQAIRGILNAGAHRLGCVSRCVGQGRDQGDQGL